MSRLPFIIRMLSCVTMASAVTVAAGGCGGGNANKAAPPTTTEPVATPGATTPDATTATSPPQLNSCALVTKSQAEAVIGAKLVDAVHESTSDVDSCTYAGDPSGPTAQVEVFVGAGAKKFYDDDKNVLQHTFTDVPGLGDEAHEEDFAVFFRKGSIWVALRLTSLDDYSTFKPRLESLATDVASHM